MSETRETYRIQHNHVLTCGMCGEETDLLFDKLCFGCTMHGEDFSLKKLRQKHASFLRSHRAVLVAKIAEIDLELARIEK